MGPQQSVVAASAGAEPVVVGFDVVRTDGAGRIVSVAGFLDVVPG